MKKNILLFLLLAIATTGFTQQIDPSPKTSATDYLKKSKNQKTVAWLLLGGGLTAMTVGSVIGTKEVLVEFGNLFTTEETKSSNAGEVVFLTGVITSLGSIPFFITSSSNKRKGLALSASVKMGNTTVIQKYCMSYTSYPVFSIRIKL